MKKMLLIMGFGLFLIICCSQPNQETVNKSTSDYPVVQIKLSGQKMVITNNNTSIPDNVIIADTESLMTIMQFEEGIEYEIVFIEGNNRAIETIPCSHIWIKDSDKSDTHQHWLGWLKWVSCKRRVIKAHCGLCNKSMTRTEHVY